MERIEAAGGRVICWNGYRVFGVLAMSRAIGITSSLQNLMDRFACCDHKIAK